MLGGPVASGIPPHQTKPQLVVLPVARLSLPLRLVYGACPLRAQFRYIIRGAVSFVPDSSGSATMASRQLPVMSKRASWPTRRAKTNKLNLLYLLAMVACLPANSLATLTHHDHIIG